MNTLRPFLFGSTLRLPRESDLRELPFDAELLGGVVALEADGLRAESGGGLYTACPPRETPCVLRAVPYYAWSNRGANAMCVWFRE